MPSKVREEKIAQGSARILKGVLLYRQYLSILKGVESIKKSINDS